MLEFIKEGALDTTKLNIDWISILWKIFQFLYVHITPDTIFSHANINTFSISMMPTQRRLCRVIALFVCTCFCRSGDCAFDDTNAADKTHNTQNT